MANDIYSLFDYTPQAVEQKYDTQMQQLYGKGGLTAIGAGIGQLFNTKKRQEMEKAGEYQKLIQDVFSRTENPYDAYMDIGKEMIRRGNTGIGQEAIKQAMSYKAVQASGKSTIADETMRLLKKRYSRASDKHPSGYLYPDEQALLQGFQRSQGVQGLITEQMARQQGLVIDRPIKQAPKLDLDLDWDKLKQKGISEKDIADAYKEDAAKTTNFLRSQGFFREANAAQPQAPARKEPTMLEKFLQAQVPPAPKESKNPYVQSKQQQAFSAGVGTITTKVLDAARRSYFNDVSDQELGMALKHGGANLAPYERQAIEAELERRIK